ncbi:antibiotic biosynthesis monooxygenase family protein [Denitromonas sp.]|uniref:antibiotic biosynthesis monooxygenase family protein n=1 Tax=Denitromonas sp. TaxID=2734609 RepID=UPI0013B61F6B|nr:antibiotic biosynthesis monooxygenase [Denitromonas sp.]KAA3650912.1 MAG: antibiotic biosynthesis monooxygenase [Pseudomonadota bacterium]
MFIAVSRFVIANGMEEAVREAFIRRPHQVDDAPGFQRMEVLRPIAQPAEFWLMTWWDDEAAFDAWHRSHAFRDAHRGMPPGLRLKPGENHITRLERVAD